MIASIFPRLIAAVLFLTTVLSAFAKADHGPHSFKAIEASVLRVLPTWPGYDRPGFGAPPGTAPEGTGFVIAAPPVHTFLEALKRLVAPIFSPRLMWLIGPPGLK